MADEAKDQESYDGSIDQFKGRVREAIGALLNDDSLRLEGRSEQWAGHAKTAASDAIDELRDLFDRKVSGSDAGSDSSKPSGQK